MRVFQNSGVYPGYVSRLRELTFNCSSFTTQVKAFLDDRYCAIHFLKPVHDQDPEAFFTNGDDEVLQRQWAKENGMPVKTTLESILLAQIEHHRTEVFYNLDPMRYGSAFLRKLPGCVHKTLAWRAAPSPGADFGGYDLLVCNFPSILEGYTQRGWRAAYFFPAHDPVMDKYAANEERPIDILFVGGYTRHHRRRVQVLDAVAKLRQSFKVIYHLDRSRLTRLAESPIGYLLPLADYRRSADIRAVSQVPLFGRDLYTAISRSKIVLNGAVDMAGLDRGNMRCFEAMGCGSLMLSDEGCYPRGMLPEKTLVTFRDEADAVARAEGLLQGDAQVLKSIAQAGHHAIRNEYSREKQWQAFQELCA